MRVLACASALLCAAAWLSPQAAHAQNYQEVAPQTLPPHAVPPPASPPLPPRPTGPAAEKIIVPAVKALVFVPGVAQVIENGREAQGVAIEGLPLLDDDAFRSMMAPFIGQPLSLARLGDITRAVVLHYRDRDHPLVDVVVPEQDINNGVVQLAVVEFRLGQIRVEGNQWFRSDVLAGEVRLRPGDPIIGRVSWSIRRCSTRIPSARSISCMSAAATPAAPISC